ncbi:unnamed protein product [Closterium sp. NIES-65]|nr:unnamed protein product [Closterium sp. NIES-65]
MAATTAQVIGCFSPEAPPSLLRSIFVAAVVLSVGCMISPTRALQSITISSRYYYVSSKTKGVSPSPYTGSFQVSVKMTEFTQLDFQGEGERHGSFSDVLPLQDAHCGDWICLLWRSP